MKLNYKTAFLAISLLCVGLSAETPHKQWEEPFSKESHEEVQGWISDLMLKFYYAYHDNNIDEMKRLNEQIQNLIHLEFESNKEINDH
jgi:hypothetical protein